MLLRSLWPYTLCTLPLLLIFPFSSLLCFFLPISLLMQWFSIHCFFPMVIPFYQLESNLLISIHFQSTAEIFDLVISFDIKSIVMPGCVTSRLFHRCSKIPDSCNLNEQGFIFTQVSVGAVHGQLVPRQKSHGGNAWQRKTVHIMISRQRKK